MGKFFRSIRFSAVGIFLTGIFAAIVGCSNEDQLRALLLLLMLLFSGGGENVPSIEACTDGATTACAIDLYTTKLNVNTDCDSGPILEEDSNGDFVFPDRSLRTGGNPGAATGDVTISVGNGKLSVFNAATTGQSCGAFLEYTTQLPALPLPAINLSAFSRVEYEVLSTSGSMTDQCDLIFFRVTFALSDTVELDFATVGPKSFKIPKANTGGIVDAISMTNCGFLQPQSGFTITPFLLVP